VKELHFPVDFMTLSGLYLAYNVGSNVGLQVDVITAVQTAYHTVLIPLPHYDRMPGMSFV
jgi:hypothetical protein